MVGMERLLRRFSVPVWQWFIVTGGVALRLLFFAREGWVPLLRGESVNIAISVVQNGTFANTYGDNSGPTAHCMPLYPLWQSLLIRIFGTGPEARYAVAFFSALAACIGFSLFPKLAERAGLGRYAGVFAGLLGAFVPFNFFPQTEGEFETSFTFLAIVLLLLLWLSVAPPENLGWRRALMFGLALGVAGLLSAALLPVLAAWLLVPFFAAPSNGRRKEWLRFAVPACLIAGVVYAPWVIRNRLALGAPVLTRSVFGLSMYQNNNDIAHANVDVDVKSKAWQVMGPFGGSEERARVRAMGEVAYNAEKLKLAKEWIQSHRRKFSLLTLERIRTFWFPTMVRPWQTAGEALVTVLGLCGMIWGLHRPSHQLAILSFAAAAVYPVVYYIVSNNPRYRFPLEGLLIFWAGTWLANRKSTTVQSHSA
jgi:hypothetical protein